MMDALSICFFLDWLCEKPQKQKAIHMRRYLVIALAAIALVVAAPSAFATRVIFDPPPVTNSSVLPPSGSCNNQFTPCNIGFINTPYTVDFIPCSTVLGVTPPSTSTWCLWMNNVTQHSVSAFTFEFTIPSGGAASGNGLSCESQGPYVATNNCPSALPGPGGLFSVSFFTTPAVPNITNFYLFTDFFDQPGNATVTASVPEPGQLGLFGLGLLALGLGYGWRKRHQARGDLDA